MIGIMIKLNNSFIKTNMDINPNKIAKAIIKKYFMIGA